ncbi:MAG: YdeI/OmpD-associated family protein [Lachnospiraceae bacterium]|nr:YdeI/OmpD-associated family protein [Lachnospiraceae bacterium]
MNTFFTSERSEWRAYLLDHFETDKEIWFVFPPDILRALMEDSTVWQNYQRFSEPYKRIRIAYIEAAEKRPEEYEKRLHNFIDKTREGKLIKGYGGIEKYYSMSTISQTSSVSSETRSC